jgi:tRNA(His) 5'-end guanylyltransferase
LTSKNLAYNAFHKEHYMQDDFGDRMKDLEGREAMRSALPGLPVVVRLDGKGFSKYTKGLERPFDARLHQLMVETTNHLVQYFNAAVGYTQSDEITIVLLDNILFSSRYQKLCSVMASKATAYFNTHKDSLPEKQREHLAIFDCRVWEVPSLMEAANAVIWREQDCTKNAISQWARHYCSHKEVMNLNGKEMQELVFSKHGANFNDVADKYKRGTFVRKKVLNTPFTTGELTSLPPKHGAHKNPNLIVTRNIFVWETLPKLSSIENIVDVLLHGSDSITFKKPKESNV